MASNTTKTAANAVDEVSMDDLSRQISILKQDVAKLTSTLGAYGQSVYGDAKEGARDRASELHAAGMDKARETQQQAEEFLRTQPATALGIAAGIGFLIGLVTAKR